VTIDELAQVPQERRRYGWVAVHMVRSSGRGRRTWLALCVIGFFPERDDAIEYANHAKSSGLKVDVCPFDDLNPIGIPKRLERGPIA
jgi:hypothetical protein